MDTIKQQHVYVECTGTGQGVVLLHGWGQNVEMLRPIYDHLSNHFRVLMLDLPGFGMSEEPHHAWSILDYVEFLELILDQYKIENPILIAHSFGARIAFRYALCNPVHKMILTGAAGIKPHHNIGYYGNVYWYKIKKHMGLQHDQMGSLDYQQASAVMKQVLVKSVNDDITPFLSALQTETLLVWGNHDEQTPLWMGKRMEKRMGNATLVTFEGDDHFAYFHQINRFLRVIDCFLVRECLSYE